MKSLDLRCKKYHYYYDKMRRKYRYLGVYEDYIWLVREISDQTVYIPQNVFYREYVPCKFSDPKY